MCVLICQVYYRVPPDQTVSREGGILLFLSFLSGPYKMNDEHKP